MDNTQKFLLSNKSPLKFNQKQRIKAEIRHEKSKQSNAKEKRQK
jgi:hypothetical protein